MEIKVRRVGVYTEVVVECDSITVNIGLLDKEEQLTLIRHLESIVDELKVLY